MNCWHYFQQCNHRIPSVTRVVYQAYWIANRILCKRECKRDAGRKTRERKGREKPYTPMAELENRTWSSNVCLQQKKPTISWDAALGVANRLREMNLCFCSGEDPPGTPCPALEYSGQEKYWPVRMDPQEGWSTYAMRKN